MLEPVYDFIKENTVEFHHWQACMCDDTDTHIDVVGWSQAWQILEHARRSDWQTRDDTQCAGTQLNEWSMSGGRDMPLYALLYLMVAKFVSFPNLCSQEICKRRHLHSQFTLHSPLQLLIVTTLYSVSHRLIWQEWKHKGLDTWTGNNPLGFYFIFFLLLLLLQSNSSLLKYKWCCFKATTLLFHSYIFCPLFSVLSFVSIQQLLLGNSSHTHICILILIS